MYLSSPLGLLFPGMRCHVPDTGHMHVCSLRVHFTVDASVGGIFVFFGLFSATG